MNWMLSGWTDARGAYLILLVAAATIGCATAHGAEKGLVAHYTFDEAAGDTAKDVSGNGHDGRISGATYVKSPRGHALRFDGVDDYVDCGSAPSLNLKGDLTLEVWFNASEVGGRNRMIFGDAAGLTVNRNYNLRLDRGTLRFEHGDGASYGVVLSEEAVRADTWHHVAIVCEAPRHYLFVNGQRVQSGPLELPITPTRGASRRIGGWFAGFFKGDIDEIRLYDRALPDRVILGHFDEHAPPGGLTAELTTHLHYSRNTADWCLRCHGLEDTGGSAEFRLLAPGREKPVVRRVEALRETRPGSQRWVAEPQVSTKGLAPGSYELQVTVRGRDGRTVASAETAFAYPEKPGWLGSREGISDKVLAPFTELRATKRGESVVVSVWGRTYEFGPSGFISSMESKQAAVLAGPMRLIGRADGRELSWKPAAPALVSQSPARCTVSQTLSGEEMNLALEASVEYDGLARIDWRLRAKRLTKLEGLALEIPLDPARAKYVYTWPKVRSGALKGDYTCGFRPIVWLGDEERGLSWLCESDQNWLLSDPEKAIQIAKGDEEVVLRLNLVDKTTELKPGDELSYSFGLQATPVKPTEEDAWDYRIVRNSWYGYSLDLPEKEVDGKPALQHYADKGVRAMLIWRWWDAFAYPLPIGHEEEFRRLVQACHQYGIKVVPYVGGFLLSDRAPEAAFFKDEMRVAPSGTYPLKMPGLPTQYGTIVCQRSPWQDFLVDGIARLIDEYDVDGVYLDSTTIPWACRNELHGCGYRKPDGTAGVTYPIFSVRENLKRIYTVVKQRKPDGIVDIHTYDCMNIPGLAFATTYWNGEQLSGKEFKLDALPLDRFRTEFMGYNWGVPADVLYYKLGGYQQCCAIALLHDVPIRAENLKDLDVEAGLWDLRERFGVKQAQWLPYWSNGQYVSISPEGCYVSLCRHPRNGVLAYVSNLSRDEAPVRMRLNAEGLGLEVPLAAKDGLSGEELSVEGVELTLSLPSQGWRTIWVRGRPG